MGKQHDGCAFLPCGATVSDGDTDMIGKWVKKRQDREALAATVPLTHAIVATIALDH